MKKLELAIFTLKEHLKQHHDLHISYEIDLYECEKNIFYFAHYFYKNNKFIYGKIDVHTKEIEYEISDVKYTNGVGFYVFSPLKKKLEKLTY